MGREPTGAAIAGRLSVWHRRVGRARFSPAPPASGTITRSASTPATSQHLEDRRRNRIYGWMNFGDWYGERDLNYGNNEYDLAWSLAVEWMHPATRELFLRGLEMARHCG